MPDEIVDQPVKELPSNNKKQTKPSPASQKATPAQKPQPEPTSFTISKEGVDELVTALNDVVTSKYVKQVIFNVLNANLKGVFDKN